MIVSAPDTPSVCPTCGSHTRFVVYGKCDPQNRPLGFMDSWHTTPSVCPTCGHAGSLQRFPAECAECDCGEPFHTPRRVRHPERRCVHIAGWVYPDCFPELFPATPTAPGSSSPDTAALVAELRAESEYVRLRSVGNGETVGMLVDAADALEAQDARITELEAAMADHTLTTPTEETE